MAFKDIRKSRKWLSPEEIRLIVILLIVLAAALALNIYLARELPAGEWLYLRWSGARSFLFDQVEPYSTTIAQRVQQIVYERNAFATEYRYVLNDPFHILLLYAPLALFPDFAIARAVWMVVAEVILIVIVFFSFRLAEWEPPRGLYVSLIMFGLFSFFSLNALVTASPSIFLTLLYLSVLLALRSHSDELAGALLFVTAYQWEVSSLFFIFVLIFVFVNRRWGILSGFGMALLILLIVSFLVNPDWGLPYIRAVISNVLQSTSFNLGHILSGWFPDARFSIGSLVSVIVITTVVIESVGAARAHFRRIVWAAALALAATPLAGLAIFPSNYVVLILPLVMILSLVWERWQRRRILVSALILLLAVFVPFGLYIRSVLEYAPLYTELLSVIPPAAAVLGLYWMRWGVVRSPRPWADQIGFRK